MSNKLKIGVIGTGKRGSWLLRICSKLDDIDIKWICDNYLDKAEACCEQIKKETTNTPKATDNYFDVLKSDVDAVIIATSWETHIQVAVDAMRAKKITGMEVGGAYSIEECWRLVSAYEETKTPFMFLENCCYNKDELLALKLAREGLFGDIVHCSGAYAHDLRLEVTTGKERRHYRLKNYMHRNCENYPTHELGPIAKIMDINRGNRMVKLVSVASKAAGLKQYILDNKDKLDPALQNQEFVQADIVDTIITCANGATIRLKLDTNTPSFYNRELTVRGTKGMYSQTANMVIIDGIDNETEYFEPVISIQKMMNNADRYNDRLPDVWKNITAEQKAAGHGGMDAIMLREFFDAIKEKREMPLDVYDAASWMAITCLSETSIQLGAAVAIPDFTNGKWINRPRKDVF